MEVTFSVFEREDGGRKAELSVAGVRALERVIEPVDPDDFDPTLRWQVDVVWDVADAPKTQTEAARWYAGRRAEVRAALGELADRLAVGLDLNPHTVVFRLDAAAGGAKARVWALRRVAPGRVAESLREAMGLDILDVEPLFVRAEVWPVGSSTPTG